MHWVLSVCPVLSGCACQWSRPASRVGGCIVGYDRYPQHLVLAAGAALGAPDPYDVFVRTGQLVELTVRHLTAIALGQLRRDFDLDTLDLDVDPSLENWAGILKQTLELYRRPELRSRFVCLPLLKQMDSKLTNRAAWKAVRWLSGRLDDPLPSRATITVGQALERMTRFHLTYGRYDAAYWPRESVTEANEVLLPAVMALFDQLTCLDQFPVVLLQEAEPGQGGLTVCHMRILQGARPRDRVVTLSGPTENLIPGHLYLARQRDDRTVPVVSLFPWAVFTPDALDPDLGRVQFLCTEGRRWQYSGLGAGAPRRLMLPTPWRPGMLRRIRPGGEAVISAEANLSAAFDGDRLLTERFSKSSWEVLKSASTEAGLAGWYQTHSAHLLLGLACRPGPLADLLRSSGLPEGLMATLGRHLIGGRRPLRNRRLPLLKSCLAADLVAIVERAVRLADRTHAHVRQVQPTHLLRAMLEHTDDSASQLLDVLGVEGRMLHHRLYGGAIETPSMALPELTPQRVRRAALTPHDEPVMPAWIITTTGKIDSRRITPDLLDMFQQALAHAQARGAAALRSETLLMAMLSADGGPAAKAVLPHAPPERRGTPARELVDWIGTHLLTDGGRNEADVYPLRLHQDSFSLNALRTLARAERLAAQTDPVGRPAAPEFVRVGQTHLLLAMLQPGSSVRRKLAQLGFDVTAIAEQTAAQPDSDKREAARPETTPTRADAATKEDLFLPNGRLNPALFTHEALEAATGAQKAARATRFESVRAPHLLMGLAARDGGFADQLFRRAGRSGRRVEQAMARMMMQTPGVQGPLALHREFFSDNLIRLLHRACAQCRRQNKPLITEKILIHVLLTNAGGHVAGALSRLGLDTLELLELAAGL